MQRTGDDSSAHQGLRHQETLHDRESLQEGAGSHKNLEQVPPVLSQEVVHAEEAGTHEVPGKRVGPLVPQSLPQDEKRRERGAAVREEVPGNALVQENQGEQGKLGEPHREHQRDDFEV